MTIRTLFNSITLSLLLVFLTVGCVTVSLSGGKNTKSEDVRVTAPALPFKEVKTADADRAWINTNGNTISYLSACGSDPTLDSLRMSVVQGLDEQDNIKTKNVTFNGREAIETWADGKVDGVAVRIRALVFKRNSCNFTLSYLGRTTYYAADEKVFEDFEQRFHVP